MCAPGPSYPKLSYSRHCLVGSLCVTSASDLLTSRSFSFQTREQLQADLLRCQAKIEDLEKLLVEKGQVSRNVGSVPLLILSPWYPWGPMISLACRGQERVCCHRHSVPLCLAWFFFVCQMHENRRWLLELRHGQELF